LLYLPAMGRAVDLETFRFGKKQVTVDIEELYDKIFFEQWGFCMWLLEHDGWRDLDAICQHFHPDHVEILSNWVEAEIVKFPD
jgi:hypothetical protein